MTRRAGEATPNELLRAARGERTQEHVAERVRQLAFRKRKNVGVTAKWWTTTDVATYAADRCPSPTLRPAAHTCGARPGSSSGMKRDRVRA